MLLFSKKHEIPEYKIAEILYVSNSESKSRKGKNTWGNSHIWRSCNREEKQKRGNYESCLLRKIHLKKLDKVFDLGHTLKPLAIQGQEKLHTR